MPTLTCIQQKSKNAGRHGAKKGGEIPCNTSLIYFPSMTTVQIPLLAQAPQGSQTTRALQFGRQTQQRSAVLLPRLLLHNKQKRRSCGKRRFPFGQRSMTRIPAGRGRLITLSAGRREASGEDGSRRQRTASRRSTGHSIKQSFSSAGQRTHGFRSRLSSGSCTGTDTVLVPCAEFGMPPTWSLNHLVSRRRAEFVPDR